MLCKSVTKARTIRGHLELLVGIYAKSATIHSSSPGPPSSAAFFFDNLMPEFELRLRISAYPFYDLCLLFGMRYIFVFRVSSTHKLRHLIATGAKGSPQNTWDLTREEHFYTPHVFAYLMQLPKGSLPLELAAKRKRIQRYPSQTVSLSNGN